MGKLRMVKDDVKRSIGFLLAVVMVFSSAFSVPISASESLGIIDAGRFVAMGFKPDEQIDYEDDGIIDYIIEGYLFTSLSKCSK